MIQQPVNQQITGHLVSLPRVSPDKVSFIVQDVHQRRYLLNWYNASQPTTPAFKPGPIYTFDVRLKPPHGLVNGVGFDREQWLFRNRIHGIGSIRSVSATGQQHTSIMVLINQWRMAMAATISAAFDKPPVHALIQALSIGDQSHFAEADRSLYQNTGTAHLIAISGLHIGMAALLGWWLGWLLFLCWPTSGINRPMLQMLMGLLSATAYAGLAGLAVSTQRALIMLLLWGWYRMRRQSGFAWDVWSGALLLVLLLDPLHVLDAGFWLSFSAVAVLILAFRGVSGQSSRLRQLLTMQWLLLVGMLPLSSLIFADIKVLAPLVNLIMVPLTNLLLIPLIMLMLLLSGLTGGIPEWLSSVLNVITAQAHGFLSFVNQWSWLNIDRPLTEAVQYLLLIAACGLLLLPPAIPQRHWGWLLLGCALWNNRPLLPAGTFKASFMDVGQGLAVLLETRHHRMVYDVGASHDSGFNMANAVLLPHLSQQGIRQLDLLILSHQDNDHAGASKQLTNQINVTTVLGTDPQSTPCTRGLKWHWDGVDFAILSPENLNPYLGNNSSCVLRVDNGRQSLLLPGDIEDPVEYRLSQQPAAELASTVLLVPHHGSKTSSTAPFIEAVDPQVAINSSGRYNPFNHPAPEVVGRYLTRDIQWYDTQTHGLLVLGFADQLSINAWGPEHPRIWRKKSPDNRAFDGFIAE